MADAPDRDEREEPRRLADRDEREEPRRLADHLLEYGREPTLWPVTLVAVAIFLTLGATALLAAVLQRSVFAMAAVALLVGMSVDLVVRELRRGGPGVGSALVLGFWIGSCAVAFAAVEIGLF